MKKCSNCAHSKPLTEFYKQNSSTDGHQRYCKICSKDRRRLWWEQNHEQAKRLNRKWGRNNSEKVQNKMRAWMNQNPDKAKEYSERSLSRHPERFSARWAVNNAVRDGKLERPTICSRCGATAGNGTIIEYHHHDYTKPLDVESICSKCHGKEHRIKD